MNTIKLRSFVSALAMLGMVSGAFGTPGLQQKASPTRLEQRVRRALVMLPQYSVFDNLAFKIEGTTVTLMGQVVRPTLKSGAEKVVLEVGDIDAVDNQIEVLPVSPNDDRIRMDTYRAIYYYPSFTRYAIRSVPPIHIIVKNGDVRLEGMVATEADKNVATMRAQGVAGVFSVTNALVVESDEDPFSALSQ